MSDASPSRPAALDPRCLGRPVHLLPQVAMRLREALHRSLCLPWNRRYHARYELSALTLAPLDAPGDASGSARWLRAQGPAGTLACHVDRALVLGLMARRLGLSQSDGPPSPETTAGTATEDRLLQSLASQCCALSLQLLAQAADEHAVAQDLPPAAELPALQPGALPAFGPDAWEMRLTIRDAAVEPARDMTLRLALDGAYVAPLLRQLGAKGRARARAVETQPLTRRLSLKLQARLLERELELGTVLDLRPGALIPIRLADATVMVEGSPLMSAAVAEHQGKLCLTSFEDLE